MKEIFLFELKYRLRRPATYIYIFLMFIIPLLLAVFNQSNTAQFTNSPNAITGVLGGLSMIGLFFYAAIMGVPVYRDEEHKTAQTYFTFPVTEKNYLLGRFFGSFTIVTIMNIGAVVGAMIGFGIGALLNRPDYGVYTSFDFMSYLLPFLFLLTINSFFIGVVFFSLMTFFKRMSILYLGGIILFILSQVASQLLGNLDNQWLSIYFDPFGNQAYSFVKKYWSINEVNTLHLPVYGEFLLNRMLWLGVAIAVFVFTLFKFSYPNFLIPKKAKKLDNDKVRSNENTLVNVTQVFSKKAQWGNLFSLSKIEFLSIVKDFAFRVLLVIGAIFSFFMATELTQTYGTPSLPMTRFMVQEVSAGILLFSVVILVIYAGEAVHRTRKNKTFEFYDALPVSNSTLYLSKIIALIAVAVVLTFATILVGIIFQTYNGYFNYELDMYLVFNFMNVFPAYVTTVLLAFFIHVLVNNKFLGHFLVIIISIGLPVLMLLAFDITNPLLVFQGVPASFLSDLNGFGHFLTGSFWLNLYWILFTGILAIMGLVFWNRGFFSSIKERFKLAKSRFNFKTTGVLVITLLLFGSVGAYSYYNLNVLNTMMGGDESTELAANAEKKYDRFIDKPHIQVVSLKAKVDIFPEERDAKAEGNFTVTNKFSSKIDTLLMEVTFPIADSKITKVVYNGTELKPVHSDEGYRLFLYKLPQPLMPKDTANLVINTTATTYGFSDGLETAILNNGTFFRDGIFPKFHYERVLSDNGTRKKYGLEEMDFLYPKRTDSLALRKNLFNEDADYVEFEAIVSTSKGQTAIAPGKLVTQWDEGERSYFEYKLGGKTDYFFNFASAKYDIEKDSWTAPSGKKVAIEVYHSPKHKRNLEHFINGVKVSLDYNSKNFLEYPYSVIRIVEFPAHSTFAQSFATTIPYSEDFGFVADFSEAEDFNYAFRVTSHEVAHQWWGHIVTPSKTSGSNIISETLAEYVSLMTMKKEFGENGIKSFLKNSLDTYLSSRQFSFKPERSLMDVETGQHIWYQKGSMVMYELQDVIGEEKINLALRSFLNEYKYFNKGVYATSENLYDAIYEVTPDSLKYKVDDGFKEIVIYENKVEDVKTKELDNGKWETTFTVSSKKVYYDNKGKERETDTKKNLVDIGLFGPDILNDDNVTIKNPYYFELKWLKSGNNTFTIVTDEKPEKVGIDPYNKLIDRNSGDNLKSVIE